MKKHFNYFLFLLVILLVGFSTVFLACLSSQASWERFGNTYYFLVHQLVLGLLPALAAGFIAYKVPIHFWKKIAPWIVLANIVALFLVLLPVIGIEAGGAKRWLDLGFTSLQPSEFLKITAILYLSAWIASKLAEVNGSDWKTNAKKSYHNIIYILLPFLVLLGIISVGLFLQKDASTLGIVSLTLLALYFSARTPLWHTLLIVISGITALAIMVKVESYRLDRWLIFLHPDSDIMGKGFQLRQSLISLGSGGIFGKGLGMSTQKFGFLPEAMTDSIFAIVGEELGFLGAFAIIAAFILFFCLGIQIAKNSNDKFSKMTAIGVVVWITLQAFINMSSSAGIFPLAGIPLPLFSYGGSRLVVELFGIGLLLNISKNTI